MDESVMRDRAERFIDKLEAMNEISRDWVYEISEGIKLMGSRDASDFIMQALDACHDLNAISLEIMYDARLRLPRPKKEEPDPRATENGERVIVFPGNGGA